MVFVSQNKIRKCKYCNNSAKINFSGGRNHGYYRTCGSDKCTKMQYQDASVCARKGRLIIKDNMTCVLCGNKFIKLSSNHKIYCKECVPESSWRARADRYGIGKKQWDYLLEKQNGKCVLCDRNPETVDHCHIKGIVRGLLCCACNMHIARMDKDRAWLHKVIKYIGG